MLSSNAKPDEQLLETRSVPSTATATEYEGAKLLVWGGMCCNRYKSPSISDATQSNFEKPAGLSKLSGETYESFIRDLQFSTQAHWPLYHPVLTSAFIVLVVVPLLIPFYEFYLYVAMCIIFEIAIFWRMNCDLQCETESRVQEWKPFFEKEGFQVDCVIDTRWYAPTETYVHIYRWSEYKAGVPWPSEEKPTPQQPPRDDFEEQAKYILVSPRIVPRRNKSLRHVPILPWKSASTFCIKPPALRNLSDDVFRDLLVDVNKAVRSAWVKRRYFLALCVVVWFVVYYLTVGFETITKPLLLLFLLLDQFVVGHLPVMSSSFTSLVDEWKPRLHTHGFCLEYTVDQPAWYHWKESYLDIHVEALWAPSSELLN